MQSRAIQRRQIEGWGLSLIIHGILLSVIIPAFRHLPAMIHPEPFRWDVTLVELPQQASVVEQTIDAPSGNELLQPDEASEPTQASLIRNLPLPVPQQTNNINETIQASNNVRPVIAIPTPTDLALAKPETVPPTASISEPTPAIQGTVPIQRNAPERPHTMVATTPVATEPSTAITASTEQEIPPQPAPSIVDVAMETAQSREPSQAPPTSVLPIASNQPSVARADYSWLQRAVSRRLEELKRFSHPSLNDASKLKVLVKAVVSGTGELMEAEVITSSGLERIDREAVTLVHRAFPMPLDYAIERPQIIMRIPITYSRD
ncbi:MAG: hypothetical protein E8D46_06205 [Nitrospira sp.]|nr:MAG: hypothetical protein E8D46_06205 [Nitrospira sp.]